MAHDFRNRVGKIFEIIFSARNLWGSNSKSDQKSLFCRNVSKIFIKNIIIKNRMVLILNSFKIAEDASSDNSC